MKISVFAMRTLEILLVVLGIVGTGPASAANPTRPMLLVASSRLAGTDFNETVLLATPLPNGTHIGFIVNRPTDTTLAKAFPKHLPSRRVIDPLYFGGPALVGRLFAAVRTPPKGAGEVLQLMPGLVLITDGAVIDRVIEATPNEARYFTGLFVWQPGQLDEEVRAGVWDVSPPDASVVFSAHPETLWRSLCRKGMRFEARSHADRRGA